MAALSPLDNRFDRLLYASVLERDGLPVSVLSALTRQGLDPWEEATRLAALPRDLAIDSLAATICRSGNGVSQIAANGIALQLVELLPAVASADGITSAASEHPISLWMIVGLFLFMMAISSSANREQKTDRNHQASAIVVEQTSKDSDRIVLMHTRK